MGVKKAQGYYGLSVLKIPLFEYEYSKDGTFRRQTFAGGFLTTEKHISEDFQQKIFKVFGFDFLRREQSRHGQEFYIGNKLIRTVSFEDELRKQYSKFVDDRHDDYYLINSNLGEAFVTLTYFIKNFIKKNGSKNPMFLLTKSYHVDLMKLILPEFEYKILPNFTNRCFSKQFEIKGHRCFFLYPFEYFCDVEKKIKRVEGTHYFDEMKNYLGIDWSEEFNKIVVPKEVEDSMLNKVKKTGLNLENFVYIAPDASSCELENSKEYWVNIAERFKDFDIFWNTTKSAPEGAKHCNLKVAEAFALAKHAKKIIALRSGFSELLTQTGVPIEIIYTKFRRSMINDISADLVLKGFSLKKLPLIENSIELNEVTV